MKFKHFLFLSLAFFFVGTSSIVNAQDVQNAQDRGVGTGNRPYPDPFRQGLEDSLWTGSLVAPSCTTLPQGHFAIETYWIDTIAKNVFENWDVEARPILRNVFSSFVQMEYGVVDHLDVIVVPQYGYTLQSGFGHGSAFQLGDTEVALKYMITKYTEGGWIPTTAFEITESIPTGKYNNLGTHEADGLGSGAFATGFTLSAQHYFWTCRGRIIRLRLGANYTISEHEISNNGLSVYNTHTPFHGHVNPGNTFTSVVGIEYSLTKAWVIAFDFVYQHGDHTVIQGFNRTLIADQFVDVPTKNIAPSSEAISVAPALEYNWNENWGVIAGVQVTAFGRRTPMNVSPQIALNIYY